ncbi:MAG: ABC transporter ATP-binding protein [Treponema sp.]|nr:ABC transporter ATP-binding protein [Treponema sp.]
MSDENILQAKNAAPKNSGQELILRAENLFKSFDLEAGFFAKKNQMVYAVNDISFDLNRGETLGIVGESGCGKSTSARMLVRMYEPTAGRVLYYPKVQDLQQGKNFGGQNIFEYNKKALDEYRRKVKYVFQDPARSLNPRMSAYSVLTDAFKYSGDKIGKDELYERAKKTFLEVGLTERHLEKRPSEFSGGQRQRVSIARALIMNPELLICDEVVSALDVSIQGQILNLLQDLRASKKLSFIFITHDLKVAGWFCDKIAVMYRGVMVEEAPAATLFKNARHPYTKILFDGAQGRVQASSVEVTSVLSKENGCPFAHRCPRAKEECAKALPPLQELGAGHRARCFFLD